MKQAGTPPSPVEQSDLLRLARRARGGAYAPYSGFRVGAALRTRRGEIVTGCNVENASYGMTLCAERIAIFKAVSEGLRQFTTLAVVSDSKEPTPPCGACRQVLWELCGDIWLVLGGARMPPQLVRLADLLPQPFHRRLLR